MTHFIVLTESSSVLGVWASEKTVDASRWGFELSLTYPNCRVRVEQAPDFESLKERLGGLDFAGHRPEAVGLRVRASSGRWPAAV